MSAFTIDLPKSISNFPDDTAPRPSISLGTDNAMWAFVLFEVGEDHSGALCIEREALQGRSGMANDASSPSIGSDALLQHPIQLRMWTTLPGISDEVLSACRIVATSS